MSAKLMCICGHSKEVHKTRTWCSVVGCNCVGFTLLEEKKPSTVTINTYEEGNMSINHEVNNCVCGHCIADHYMGLHCTNNMRHCAICERVEEKKPSSMRYTCVKLGAGYGVVDTTIDTIICFCSTQEYASSIMGAMNYMEDVSKAQQALSNINIEV